MLRIDKHGQLTSDEYIYEIKAFVEQNNVKGRFTKLLGKNMFYFHVGKDDFQRIKKMAKDLHNDEIKFSNPIETMKAMIRLAERITEEDAKKDS